MADQYERELFLSAIAGMAGNIAPILLKPEQAARLLNCSSRGGLPKTRPRIVRHPTGLNSGYFQGAFRYRLNDADRIVYCLSGTVFCLNLETGDATRIASFPTTQFERAYFCQVDKYCVVQNGIYDPVENWPIVIDGDAQIDNTTATFFDPADSTFKAVSASGDPDRYRIPIGTAMAYGQGRLFVAVDRFKTDLSGSAYVSGNGERYIAAGDPLQVDNVTGVLAFAEYAIGDILGTQVFGLSNELGLITSMGFFRNSYSGTGLGPLIVIAQKGSMAFAVDLPRDSWVTYADADPSTGNASVPFGKVLFFDSGSDSAWSLTSVNDDLVYRGPDGLRTVKYTQAFESNSSGSLSNVPYSTEVDTYFSRDTREHREAVSVAYSDNRIITTSGGELMTNFGIGFNTLVSLDTNVVSSITSDRPMRGFDGAWTGPIFLFVVPGVYNNKERMFVFCKDRNSPTLFLAYLDDSSVYDLEDERPVCRVYTRGMYFKNWALAKEFKFVDLWFSGVEGELNAKVYWRPDGSPVWREGRARTVNVASGSLAANIMQMRLTPGETYENECDAATKNNIRLGFTFQFCVEWQGKAQLDRALFAAKFMTDRVSDDSPCETPDAITIVADLSGIDLNDFTAYQV